MVVPKVKIQYTVLGDHKQQKKKEKKNYNCLSFWLKFTKQKEVLNNNYEVPAGPFSPPFKLPDQEEQRCHVISTGCLVFIS